MTRKSLGCLRGGAVALTMLALGACASGRYEGAAMKPEPTLEIVPLKSGNAIVGCKVEGGGNVRIRVPPNGSRTVTWNSDQAFSVTFQPLPDEDMLFGDDLGRGGRALASERDPKVAGQHQVVLLITGDANKKGTYVTKYTVHCSVGEPYDPVVIVDR